MPYSPRCVKSVCALDGSATHKLRKQAIGSSLLSAIRLPGLYPKWTTDSRQNDRQNGRAMNMSKPSSPFSLQIQELSDLFTILAARFMPGLLPVGQGALVHTKKLLAFVRWHFQVEPALLDLFTEMLGIGWILA
jgi:hypothetical protein